MEDAILRPPRHGSSGPRDVSFTDEFERVPGSGAETWFTAPSGRRDSPG